MSSDSSSSDRGHDDSFWEYEYSRPEAADRNPTTAPRLEKMASVSAAIALWNHAIVTRPDLIEYDWYSRLNRELSKWIDVLHVPKSLAESIERNFYTLRYNIQSGWIPYIYRAVFLKRVEAYQLYQHIDHIIWHPNGTINSAETAQNLLKSNKLSISDKFRFASTYCLREEIEKLWPMVQYDDDLVDESWFSEYPLIYYWRCYCIDKLNIIRTPENMSIDEFMIQQRFVNNWPAIEYFFDRLDVEQQVTQAIWLIDNHGLDFQKFLLAKLNESQRLRVIMNRGVEIIDNYTSYGSIDDYKNDLTISTWYEFRDYVTEQQFLDLFGVLLNNPAEEFVLIEIWKTSRDDLKHYLLSYDNDDFIIGILQLCEWRPKQSPDFFSTVLMDHVSVGIRREITKKVFFNTCCKRCILKNSSELLDHLLNLCFTDVEELAKFKLSLTKSWYFSPHCKSLIVKHKIQELANLLNVVFTKTDPSSLQLVRKLLGKHLGNLDQKCLTDYSAGNLKQVTDLLAPLASSYPEIITDYKSKLLKSRAGFKVCLNLFDSTNDALVEIIADAFPVNSAAKFKNRIIFSCEGIDKVQSMIVDGHSSNAEKWARLFLESDADRSILRTLLIDRLKDGKRDVHTKTRRKFMEFLL
ncbi:uncharacterized protein LOC135845533 [Planococcus citri]|uniref:uncharacterized protein LOC135845533 n=1 Tax=Planococcus citri TaxID=170843 RepID=UPI0031F73E10